MKRFVPLVERSVKCGTTTIAERAESVDDHEAEHGSGPRHGDVHREVTTPGVPDDPVPRDAEPVDDGQAIGDMRVHGDRPFEARWRKAALLIADSVEDRSKLCGEAFCVIAETRATV